MTRVKDLLEAKGPRLVTIAPDKSVAVAMRVMQNENIGALIVVDDDRALVGILSERDIVFKLDVPKDAYSDIPISTIMTSEVITCQPEDPVHQAAKQMGMLRCRHLPVLDGGRLIGMISIRDILKFSEDELAA